MEQVNKGGICWFDLGIDTRHNGLEIFVKVDSRIEALFQEASGGKKICVSEFGDMWRPIKDMGKLEVYALPDIAFEGFRSLHIGVGEHLRDLKGFANLAFLRLVGIGHADGVRFIVGGPMSPKLARELSRLLTDGVRDFVKAFLIPIHIELRLSSKEF